MTARKRRPQPADGRQNSEIQSLASATRAISHTEPVCEHSFLPVIPLEWYLSLSALLYHCVCQRSYETRPAQSCRGRSEFCQHLARHCQIPPELRWLLSCKHQLTSQKHNLSLVKCQRGSEFG